MYETETFDVILQRMLDRVPSDIDKREGAVIYDALAPAALELAKLYYQLDVNLNMFFTQTTEGMFLDLKAADFGLTRKPAVKARHLVRISGWTAPLLSVPVGVRFRAGDETYTVFESRADGMHVLECEQAGSLANSPLTDSEWLPVDVVVDFKGLEWVANERLGVDVESDDALRERLLLRMRTPAASGSVSDYMNWSLSVPGIGGVKVLPKWNGPGTVKIALLGSDKKPATSLAVTAVSEYIGNLAPVGAGVTVEAATPVTVNVNATVILKSTTSSFALDTFKNKVEEYLRSIAFTDSPDVMIHRIGYLLLDTVGVSDYSVLTLNGTSSNVTVPQSATMAKVAVLGSVNVNVST